jgi:ABC-type glycerol-3-phosphate transport system permease component
VWHVIIPLSKPVIFTHGLMSFLGVWNDLMGPLLYVNVPEKHTLQLVLYRIQARYNFVYGYAYGDTTGLRIQTLFAVLILGSLPTILVFIAFQKRVVEGVVITGLKL